MTGGPARSIAIGLAAVTIAGAGLGFAAAFPVAIVAVLWIAWRHDNAAGALFPLAILLVLAVAILAALIAFLAVAVRA